MEENQQGKGEKFFSEFGRRIDQFVVEAKDASTRIEADLQKKYEELKQAADRFKNETENKERWKEVEASLKRAGEELEKAFKSAFKPRT
ncbi:MAG: hypothetical protein ACOYW3_11955 [Bacteroidota bacterium]